MKLGLLDRPNSPSWIIHALARSPDEEVQVVAILDNRLPDDISRELLKNANNAKNWRSSPAKITPRGSMVHLSETLTRTFNLRRFLKCNNLMVVALRLYGGQLNA